MNLKGKSKRGLYGDVVEELDWSVGEILKAVKDLKLEKNTLVIFTSDNGPWIREKQEWFARKTILRRNIM